MLPMPSAPTDHRAATLALVLSIGLLVSACGAPAARPENELYREASLAFEEESYSAAINGYKKLLEEFPFSDKAEVASLNIAYAHYLKEEYGEAIAAFNDFERLYPVSPLLPFVSYTIGMCWLDQAKAADRDATASAQALRQFRKVVSEFPHTLHADLARFRQQQARENLAAHEIVVGDYYQEREQLDAAANRYRHAIREYPGTESAARAARRLEELHLASAPPAPDAAPTGGTPAAPAEVEPAPERNEDAAEASAAATGETVGP